MARAGVLVHHQSGEVTPGGARQDQDAGGRDLPERDLAEPDLPERDRADHVLRYDRVREAGDADELTEEPDPYWEPVALGLPWGLPLCLGLLSIGFGAAALASSQRGLLFFATLVGAWFFTTGATRVSAAVVTRESDTMGELVFSALAGLLLMVAGVLSLRDLVTDVLLVVACLAAAWLLVGFADLMMATAGQPGSGWLAVSGVLGLAVGVGFLLVPNALLSVAVPLTGTTAVGVGLVWVVVAFGARSAARRATTLVPAVEG